MNNNQILSAFLVGLGLFGQSCGTNTNKSEQAGGRLQAEVTIPVTTALVSKEIVSGTKSYPANVVPLQETEIRAEVSGYITNIYVGDSAYVSKGQRLYEIDRTRYQASLEQAEANLAIAKA